jgi:Tfp pilus assembly protein PilO
MSEQQNNTAQKQATTNNEGWKEQLIKSVAGENEGIKTALNILLNDITLGAAVGMIGMWFMKGKGMAEELEAARKENKELKEELEELQEQLEELKDEVKDMKARQLPQGRPPAAELNGTNRPGKSHRRYNTALLD